MINQYPYQMEQSAMPSPLVENVQSNSAESKRLSTGSHCLLNGQSAVGYAGFLSREEEKTWFKNSGLVDVWGLS
jgi:hypothetical protein